MEREFFKKSSTKYLAAFFSFALFFLFNNSASALTCVVDSAANCAATGKTPLLKMSATDNAHAEFTSETNYSNILCCSESGVTVGTSCSIGPSWTSSDVFLKLQQTTNSHVGKKGAFSAYTRTACVSVDTGTIGCQYATGGANCNTIAANYTCLGEISGDDNAHIGNCSTAYTDKICCGYSPAAPICTRADPTVSISPASHTGNAGDPAYTYNVSITNNDTVACGASTITTTATPCPAGWTCSINGSSTSIDPQTTNTTNVELLVSPSAAAVSSTYNVGVYSTANATTGTASADYVISAAPVLSVTADPPSVTQNTATNVEFTVTNGGLAISGATISLGLTLCTTNASGKCTATLDLNSDVTITASKATYTNGTTIITATSVLCTVVPNSCDDSDPCTTDTCNPGVGCSYSNNANPCNDGNLCTSGDACSGGTCSGSAVSCSDVNSCTDDSCDPAVGCFFSNNTNPCNDSNACTSGDACSGGTCSGSAVSCSDGNSCTDDSCNNLTGCVFTNNTSPCSDGNPCTLNDLCGGGGCISGAPKVCNTPPNTQCYDTLGVCVVATGNCSYTMKPDDTFCDDGGDCTVNDLCKTGTCVAGPNSCGGIIPCGRHANNPSTLWDDTQPCGFCTLILLLQLIIEFLLKLATIVSVFITAYAGLRYVTAAGDTSGMEGAKTALKYTLTGFAVIFISWALVSTILTVTGYINPINGAWYAINCSIQ